MNVQPVVLEGEHVRLSPLRIDHLDALAKVGTDESLSRYLWYPIHTRADMSKFITDALQEQARGVSLPFVTLEKSSGSPVGSTRYLNIDRQHHRVEIGGTWIATAWQRTAINTEAKYLMLRHAFEILDCIRVELKTDSLNERSRRPSRASEQRRKASSAIT